MTMILKKKFIQLIVFKRRRNQSLNVDHIITTRKKLLNNYEESSTTPTLSEGKANYKHEQRIKISNSSYRVKS